VSAVTDGAMLAQRFRDALSWARRERGIVDEAPIVLDYGLSATRLPFTVRDLAALLEYADRSVPTHATSREVQT
jgi:hypothetical protein